MAETMEFIFASFWHYIGTMLLIATLGASFGGWFHHCPYCEDQDEEGGEG